MFNALIAITIVGMGLGLLANFAVSKGKLKERTRNLKEANKNIINQAKKAARSTVATASDVISFLRERAKHKRNNKR